MIEGSGEMGMDRLLQAIDGSHAESLPHADEKLAPVQLSGGWGKLTLRWWLNPSGTEASPLKMWAGQQRSLHPFSAICGKVTGAVAHMGERPFDAWLPLSSRFGFDPRSSWNQLDVGYSPNLQGQEVRTFPVVELFTAIALESLAPFLWTGRGRLSTLRYRLFERAFAPLPARAAIADGLDGAGGEAYEAYLDKRGSFFAFTFANRIRDQETQQEREEQA